MSAACCTVSCGTPSSTTESSSSGSGARGPRAPPRHDRGRGGGPAEGTPEESLPAPLPYDRVPGPFLLPRHGPGLLDMASDVRQSPSRPQTGEPPRGHEHPRDPLPAQPQPPPELSSITATCSPSHSTSTTRSASVPSSRRASL